MNVLKSWVECHDGIIRMAPHAEDQVQFLGPNGNKCVVHLDSKKTYQSRLGILLHECGHILVHRNRKRERNKRVSGATFQEWMRERGRCKKGTKMAKLSTLDEEFAAWTLGERLGKRLGIKLNRKKFELLRTKCLLTYIRDCAY